MCSLMEFTSRTNILDTVFINILKLKKIVATTETSILYF